MWLCNVVKRVNFSQVRPTSLPLYFIISYEVLSLVAELFEPHTAIPNFSLLVNESSSVIASYKHCSSNLEAEVVKHNHNVC